MTGALVTVALIVGCALAGGGLAFAATCRSRARGRALFAFMVGELVGAGVGATLAVAIR